LLSIGLSWSHDLDHVFSRLTQVVFLIIFSLISSFKLIESGFVIYVNLFYMGLSWSHDPGREFERLTLIESGLSKMLLFEYLKKEYHLELFLIKLYFYQSFRLHLDSSSLLDHIGSTPTQLKFFSTKKTLASSGYFFLH
jgi:hypothetical protein